MKAAAFDYVAPTTVAAALGALAGGDGEYRIFAGGQSLAPLLNLRLATPRCLVDLGGIKELRRVENRSDDHFIGAMVTHAAIEDGAISGGVGLMLAHVAGTIAYRAIRNRGTIGGSLAHADPAADWPAALLALKARAVLSGGAGEREVPVRDFLRGAFTTALGEGEILTAILVPRLSDAARWGYYKICRKAGEFPEAIGAAIFDRERRYAGIVMGALAAPPVPLDELARSVAIEGPAAASLDRIEESVRGATPDLDPIETRMHAVAVRRAVMQALAA
jgi:carbon-monoxide dehydrogenase medium subunit